MHRLRSPLALVGWLAVLSSALASQSPEVRGASIALLPRGVDVQVITIENRHTTPLIAWELRWPAAAGGASTSGADHSGYSLPRQPGGGPIQPNERRTIEQPSAQSAAIASPVVTLAVFADGSIFGAPDTRERWLRAREQQRDDAAYWVRAFERIPDGPADVVKRYLAASVVERTSKAPKDPTGTRARLAGLWQSAPYNPGPVDAVVARAQAEVEQQHRALTRVLASARMVPGPAPLAIAGDTTTKSDYAVAVTNLRQVPIEALGFTIAHAAEDRTGQSMDFCMAPPGDPRGRIAPGETRHFHLGTRIQDLTEPWEPRLVFVLFDDLFFEGSASERDDVLRRREQQADDIAFANAVRLALASVPDERLQEFLRAKRAERTEHLLATGRRPDQPRLDEMSEQAARSPAELRRLAALIVAGEEEQRQHLVRHRR